MPKIYSQYCWSTQTWKNPLWTSCLNLITIHTKGSPHKENHVGTHPCPLDVLDAIFDHRRIMSDRTSHITDCLENAKEKRIEGIFFTKFQVQGQQSVSCFVNFSWVLNWRGLWQSLGMSDKVSPGIEHLLRISLNFHCPPATGQCTIQTDPHVENTQTRTKCTLW